MCVNCANLNTLHPLRGSHLLVSWSIQFTGGAVNTARAFGPAVVTGFPHGSHWVVRIPHCKTPITYLRIGLVLGWSVLRVVPRVGLLHDLETVRYQIDFIVRVIQNNACYFAAGNTGLLIRTKLSPIRGCHLRILFSPYDGPPVSETHTMTITKKSLQVVRNHRLQPISRQHHWTTWFDFLTEIRC